MYLFRKKHNIIPPFVKIDIAIDSAFTIKEKGQIIEALIRWQNSMYGLLQFHIGNLSATELLLHEEDTHTWYAMNIIKAYSTDIGIIDHEITYGGSINGLAVFLDYTTFAFIVVDRLHTDEDFIGLVMHEVGHLLGLDHSANKTVMYEYLSRARQVTNDDRAQLIHNWRQWFGLENKGSNNHQTSQTNQSKPSILVLSK